VFYLLSCWITYIINIFIRNNVKAVWDADPGCDESAFDAVNNNKFMLLIVFV